MKRETLNVALLQLLMLMTCAAHLCVAQPPCSFYSPPPTGNFYVYTVSLLLRVRDIDILIPYGTCVHVYESDVHVNVRS